MSVVEIPIEDVRLDGDTQARYQLDWVAVDRSFAKEADSVTHKIESHPLRDALDAESYDWLTTHAPRLLDAIEQELVQGKTPEQLRRIVQDNIGAERVGLALRIEQAARAILAQAQR